MEYRMIYKAYNHAQLMGRQGMVRDQERYEARNEAQYLSEAQDWSNALNAAVGEGFTVKDSGAIQFAEDIVFWALMEKR